MALPSALIDFRSCGAGCAPLHLAFGTPRETLVARRVEEVPSVLKLAQARARDGAWCVGSLHFEAAGAFDAALRTHAVAAGSGPPARFLVYDAPLTEAEASIAWQFGASHSARVAWCEEPDRAAFDAAIARIHAAIEAGEFYQVNFTAPIEGRLEGEPLALFDAMRRAQPNAYAAYIAGGDDADTVLSVSPELFFDWRDGRLLASPMKGTGPRGAGAMQDAEARERLIASEKERAENVMIVDLLRNDLSRVAEPFSVRVLRLFHPEAWPTVWQLSSEIECRTLPGVELVDVFGALFPCGSVTGAPKVQAMRMIHDLEPAPRGVYCGAVGVIRPGGSATFNVPIRTIALRGQHVRCGIGSGITADAKAADEWMEWRHKRAFAERASEPFELLETLRLRDGRLANEPAHLARMAGAALHFGFAFDKTHASAQLHALAARHPQGDWRVRLLCDRLGTVRTQAFPLEASPPRLSVQLAAMPIEGCDGEFFRFKTTRRAHYGPFAPGTPALFDTLLWNERGELTEFTRGNVALRIDGEWLTPPLHCGLLPGVERARLLGAGRLREAVVHRDALAQAQAIAFFNSLRGWLEVRMIEPLSHAPAASSGR